MTQADLASFFGIHAHVWLEKMDLNGVCFQVMVGMLSFTISPQSATSSGITVTSIRCRQVSVALSEEIRRLSVMVDEFSAPFHPDPLVMNVYKKELHNHVEAGLGSNLKSRLSTAVAANVESTQNLMAGQRGWDGADQRGWDGSGPRYGDLSLLTL